MRVTFFKTTSGRSPVLEYIQGLAKPESARLFEALDQIERYGFDAVRVQFGRSRVSFGKSKSGPIGFFT